MKTITCGANQVLVTEVAKTGGILNEFTNYEDTLFRDTLGQYYLEEMREQTFPPRHRQICPADSRDGLQHRRIKPVSDKSAMLWFIEHHVEDAALAEMFTWLVLGTHRPESNVIVRFPLQGALAMTGGAR